MFFFKVTSFIVQGVSRHGVARSLDNICNSIFLTTNMVGFVGLIRRRSWERAQGPCLLLFGQDPFLARQPRSASVSPRWPALLCLFVTYVHMISLLAC